MQAIQLTQYGKPEEGLRLVEIAEPGDPKSGQILIRVEYAPINDSDLLVASGLYAVHPKLPSVRKGRAVLVAPLHPAQRPHRPRPGGAVRAGEGGPADPEVRARPSRGRGGLCDPPRAVLRVRVAGQLGRGGRPAGRGRHPR